MEVIEKIHNNTQQFPPTAVALGYFDGVHLGHQKLILTTQKIAKEKKIKSVVFTFKEHPLTILSPEKSPKLISTNDKKIKVIQSFHIDYMILTEFTHHIMNSLPEDFIKNILVGRLNVKHIVVGFNYRFGYKGLGTTETLIKLGKKYGFDVTIVKPVKVEDRIVSSTLIRQLISNGQMESLEKYLGRPYSVQGKVVHGKGLGKKISIPTANIHVENDIILPKFGVYHTFVQYHNVKYNAVTSLGFNPTFENHPLSIESYLLDFEKNIYGEEIEVFFKKRIRPAIKFDSLKELTDQINKDIEFARKNG